MRAPHRFALTLGCILLLCAGAAVAGEEPPLPPAPPEAQDTEPGEPAMPPLPEGPAEEEAPSEEPTFSDRLDRELQRLPVPLHGFWEARIGPRLVEDNDHSRDFTLGETRLQLESDPFWRGLDFMFKADFLYDPVLSELLVEWREANVAFSPLEFMDVKLGRQVLTWGTGDLVFLNDLFPKDYESFFIGRDVEYLKAPSDAVKLSFFSDYANLDLVYTPHFDSDDFVTGKRLSYYNPLLGARAGDSLRIRTEYPGSWFTDDEVALRLYRNVGSYELAGYAYRGFWKSPGGINPASGRYTFPELSAYGASARGPFAGGIGNAEFAWYDSRDDAGGDNPFVPNGQLRFLVGYSRDLPRLARDFTVGVQYYVEHMLDYGEYRRNLPAGMPRVDENRHLLTLRLTKLLLNQDLKLELFTFWSPSDHEAYLRPFVSYDITDRWRVDAGANIFMGDEGHTPFAQFDRNNNAYVGLRYSF
ncbi:MAG: hypothetical protein PVJ27_06025 [Candidatus Brocadiaceae bacterium]|jgi:hypothetical protein